MLITCLLIQVLCLLVNVNVTTSSGVGNTPSQDVCIALTNNILLSCVNNVASSSDTNADDDNSTVTVAIVLPVCLAMLLLIILIVILYRRLRIKLKSTRLG